MLEKCEIHENLFCKFVYNLLIKHCVVYIVSPLGDRYRLQGVGELLYVIEKQSF